MIQVSTNVCVESDIKFCNLGLITTKQGNVLIDTPMFLADAVKWRNEIMKRGKTRYVVNTEEHADHYQSSWFFSGVLITSEETRKKLGKISPAEFVNRIKSTNPDALSFLEKGYQLRLADITFSENLSFFLGDHTFRLFQLQGHSKGGIGVYIPEERVVFATDCVFHRVMTWLKEADPQKWLKSIIKLEELDIETIVPGHGSVCKKDYLKEQANIIQKWVDVVKSALSKGWSLEEAIKRIKSPDPYPKQLGSPMTRDELNRANVTRLYSYYTEELA